MKISFWSQPRWAGARVKGRQGLLLAVFLTALGLTAACGQIRPLPSSWDPEAYTPITYAQLLDLRAAGLTSGQKVKVPVYFWQFLIYDPALVQNYITLARHPIDWYRLPWFATYGTPDMKGYFDRLVMTEEQQESYRLKRLEHLLVYGELAYMGLDLLYLQVHHIERITED